MLIVVRKPTGEFSPDKPEYNNPIAGIAGIFIDSAAAEDCWRAKQLEITKQGIIGYYYDVYSIESDLDRIVRGIR